MPRSSGSARRKSKAPPSCSVPCRTSSMFARCSRASRKSQEDAAARRAGLGVHRSRPSLRASGGVAGRLPRSAVRQFTRTPLPEEFVIADLTTEALPAFEPADAFTRVMKAGYRSFLGVRVPAREQEIELAFWSKRPGAFTPRDLPVARRIADHIALSISHEQLVEAERHAAEVAGTRRAARSARADALRGARIEDADSRRRPVRGMARCVEEGDPGRGDGHDRAGHRRVRHGQGSRRPLHPSGIRAQPRPVRGVELCGAPRAVARVGALRLRARRVHQRPAGQTRPDRAGRRRRAVPRRSHRDEPDRAGEGAARAAGTRIPAPRRHSTPEGQHSGGGGDQSRPRGRRWSAATSARTCSIA